LHLILETKFDNNKEVSDFKIIPDSLEISTVAYMQITTEMLIVLDSLLNEVNEKNVQKIKRKIYYLEMIQEAYLINNNNESFLETSETGIYSNIIEFYKSYLSLDDIVIK
jgi:hypothetical protein